MTRAQIEQYVRDRLGISSAETGRVTQIQNAISREYQKLATLLGLGDDTADLVFTADDPLVDLPDDCGRITSIRRGKYVLQRLSRRQYAEFMAAGPEAGIGPVVYVQEAPSRIRVGPAPYEDSTEGAVLEYVVRPVALDDDDEPDLLPEEYHDLLGELVIVTTAMTEEEQVHLNAAQSRADRLMADLKTFLNIRPGTIPVQIPIPGNL